jgi:hypothetical protein
MRDSGDMLLGGAKGNDKKEIDTSTFRVSTAAAMIPLSCVNSISPCAFSFRRV